jgi:signal transduction histidine kinase/DNA-binding response OmpR family regulator
MDLAKRLAEERRARLAAERLLELKQAELSEANRRLGRHALKLSQEIRVTKSEVAEVRGENARVISELGEVTNRFQEVSHEFEKVTDQLWHAMESFHDGFCMFDKDDRIVIANSAYLAVFDGIESVGPGATFDHVLELLADEGIVDLRGEAPQSWKDRQMKRWKSDPIPSDTIRLYNGRFLKMRDRRLSNGGTVSLAVDITELMRMWSAVEELPDGFVMYDADDRLLMANDKYREMYAASSPALTTGATFEEVLLFGLQNGQYPEAIGREDEWLEERLTYHRDPDREQEQQIDDGRWLRIYERETSDGGRVGLRIDISDIKRDQQQLQEAMIHAEAANRAKSAFLANMSHEIRTPMNGVVGMAELMMDTDLSEDQKLYLDTIRSSGEALLVIINDILDYSKIEADKLELQTAPFDLERALHEVVMLLQPTSRGKDVALLVDYDMFLPTRFVGDVGRVRQILTNLLGNAVKFTNQGHVLLRVVGVCDDGGQTALHIIVEDTGIGIPEDKVDHVFGEFNQVEDERNRKFEGTGLGLAITRKLVELMGGEVWVDSELGKGSCFGLRIVLPADEPLVYERAQLPDHLKRVLVVDDHSVNRMIITKQLAILGVQADYCTTGAEALDMLEKTLPDLLLIEQELPDIQGLELVAQIQQRGHEIPVILLSDTPGQINPVAGATVHALLQKPAPRRVLFSAMETIPKREKTAPKPVPRKQAALPATVDDAQVSAPETAAETTPGALSSTLDVLVAEDNKTNQLVFSKMAKSFDVALRFANNGLEAVQAYKDWTPDLIFMDISMPEMDGKEATRQIRLLEGDGPNVPIIAVTAHAMAGDKEAILEAGLTDYMTKPVRKSVLGDKIALYRAQLDRAKQAS